MLSLLYSCLRVLLSPLCTSERTLKRGQTALLPIFLLVSFSYHSLGHDSPYLSIITATRNDDYNGIRARYFLFVSSLRNSLSVSNVSSEVIIVQYNPNENALPVTALFPHPVSAEYSLRVITVPRRFHTYPSKGFFGSILQRMLEHGVPLGNSYSLQTSMILYPPV